MKKLIVGAGTVGAAAVSMMLFGTGVAAAADDYAGQTYADASAAASDAGSTVVVASRTGSKLDEDNCIVERSQAAPFASANDGVHVDSQVQFYLNCDGAYATPKSPGKSQASPEGSAAKASDEEAAAEEEAQAAEEAPIEEVSTPDE